MAEIRANNVPDELVQRFDIERARRGRLSIREAVMEAIQLWIETPAGGRPAVETPVHASEEHKMLDLILSSDPQAAEWIRGNLKMFAEALMRRGGKRREAKTG
jgi:hypothetical protein